MFQIIKRFFFDIHSGKLYKKAERIKITLNSNVEKVFYISILSIFLIYYELQTIMYPAEWIGFNYFYLKTFLCVFLFVKYVLKENRKIGVLEFVLAVMIIYSFMMSYQNAGYGILLDTMLLILGAKDISYRLIVKTYIAVKVPIIFLTIICSKIGIVTNLIYNQHGRIREALGFVYPTDFAAQIFFVFIAWVCLREIKISYLELIVMLVIAGILKRYCDARCSVLCIVLLVVWITFLKCMQHISVNYKVIYWGKCIFRGSALASPYLFTLFMILASRFYNPENEILKKINKLINNRLLLGNKGFEDYDSSLYGQYITMIGNGGTTEQPQNYNFLDCSYVNMWLRFGGLVFIVVLLIISYLMLKNWNNILLIGIIVLICLHSIIEHHLFEFYYNIMILLPLAHFKITEYTKV